MSRDGRQTTQLAAGHLGVLYPDGGIHVGGRQRKLRQPIRVEPDAHRVLGTELQHLADAIHAAQRFEHVRCDKIAQIRHAQAAIFGYERQHHQVGLADLVDLHALLRDFVRQQRQGGLQLVLHLHLGNIGVGAGLEGQRQLRVTGDVALGGHVQQAVQADHFLLDDLRDGAVQGLRRGAGVGGADLHRRWRHVRVAFDR